MNKYSPVKVGVAGVTGYSGVELMRRLARHPHVDVRLAMASATLAPQLAKRGTRVFDLSGAFRIRDVESRKKWYPHSPANGNAAYGLTEQNREAMRDATLVACAGC